MKTMCNNKGAALITALMLTLIALTMISALMLIVTRGTYLSGANKRYQTALAASYGGVDISTKELIPAIFAGYSSVGDFSTARQKMVTDFALIGLNVVASDACMNQKLNSPTSKWSSCSAVQASSEITSIKSAPDLTFNLKGTIDQGYKVYTKIVDTSPGNTDPSSAKMINAADKAFGGIIGYAGVAYIRGGDGGGGGVSVPHIPVRYRIEIQGERSSNATEKSNLSVLYAY
ncbi:MAG: hypothetical protein WC007_02870 [Pelobacteraceae bacterium]